MWYDHKVPKNLEVIRSALPAQGPSEATMEIECVGKISGNGQILIDPSLLERAEIGSMIKLKISVPDEKV